jgi:phage tail-like protein
MTSSIINRFSTLATDPLRSFRFYAEFSKCDGQTVFDDRILSTTKTTPPTTGKSEGWVGGFSQISGLSINTQAIQYREGGYNTTVHQIPGMTTFTPITFQRGVLFGNDQAITWMRGLFATTAGEGLRQGGSTKSFRVNVNIYVMDHPNSAGTAANSSANVPRMGFKVHNAWISTLNYTDLNAADGAILFESMSLVHEGLSAFYTDDKYNRKDGVKK